MAAHLNHSRQYGRHSGFFFSTDYWLLTTIYPHVHVFQRTMVTRVPWPGSDSMRNSSTRRREPGKPLPRPLPVEKPSRIASSRLLMPGPLSSKMRRSPVRPSDTSVGCAIKRPRPAYLITFRASSEVTVASRVWSIMRKPREAATIRTSLRATMMSCSFSSAIDLLPKTDDLPVRLFVLVRDVKLAAQHSYALVHVEDRVDALQLKPQLDERDGDRRLHADHDGARVHDTRHRRDVREHATDERIDHLQKRDVNQ